MAEAKTKPTASNICGYLESRASPEPSRIAIP